jgi:hypothetical protein
VHRLLLVTLWLLVAAEAALEMGVVVVLEVY